MNTHDNPTQQSNSPGPELRAPETPPMRRRNIWIDDSTWDFVTKVGNGNASAGIRWLINKAREGSNKGIK